VGWSTLFTTIGPAVLVMRRWPDDATLTVLTYEKWGCPDTSAINVIASANVEHAIAMRFHVQFASRWSVLQ
jgi:hypothetical protein